MSVEFTDNTAKIKDMLKKNTIKWLYEAGGEIQSQTQRNSRVDNGETKGSYKYVVDENNLSVSVGSDLENAIWEEFGTGEYALHGDGRKGGWYIPEEKLSAKAKSHMQKVIGKDGKVYYHTYGKKPNRPLQKAYNTSKDKLIRRFAEILIGK